MWPPGPHGRAQAAGDTTKPLNHIAPRVVQHPELWGCLTGTHLTPGEVCWEVGGWQHQDSQQSPWYKGGSADRALLVCRGCSSS